MTTRTIQIADATEAELRRFATEALGLPISPRAGSELIRSRIATCYERQEFNLTDAEDGPAQLPAPAAREATDGAPTEVVVTDEPWFVVNIPTTEATGGTEPVPVCVNGRNMWIERGKDQRIKHRYFEALKNAVQTVYEQRDGPDGEITSRDVSAYPFTVVERPTQEILDAWSQHKADQQTAGLEAA